MSVHRTVIPALILAGLVIPPLLLNLPADIAIHWGLDGHPNSHAPWGLVTTALAVGWIVAWAALTASHGRDSTASIYALGGLLVAGNTAGLIVNAGKRGWQEANLPTAWITIPAVLVIGLIAALIGAWLAGPGPAPNPGPSVWTGRAHNRWMLVIPPIAVLVALFVTGSPLATVVILTVGVVIAFATVEVVVGPAAVVVQIGLLKWPRRIIPLAEIEEAHVITVAPLAYGGWGWRRRPGRTAVVIRRGPALELLLRNDKRFIVTVDDPEQAAGLINDYAKAR
ncbi:hypothetical protein [Actinocrispum sp. NPDC049592]|uniref:hypothetical protein n=1 Tax=Actinocrispum sp. NPDC049592 TaxID=3154835 RepID=UPI00342AB747